MPASSLVTIKVFLLGNSPELHLFLKPIFPIRTLPLTNLGGRGNKKIGHLDKTKDLASPIPTLPGN
jgi:hypothetical protein